MLESYRRSLGERWTAFRLRKTSDSVISFSSAVSSAKDVLLILPLDHSELLAAMEVIEMAKERFAPKSITVVGDESGHETRRLLPGSDFIQISLADLNVLYVPRPAFLQQITKKYYDIAIDLNLDLVLPSAYICRESNARVRVGFTRKHADRFYNFLIQPDPAQSRRSVYDRLARCLDMF